MRAIIHIGTPKAGSSSIQAFLGDNVAALARQGVRYRRFEPAFGSQYELGVTALVRGGSAVEEVFAQRTLGFDGIASQQDYACRFSAAFDGWRADWARSDVYVASSEHLYAWLTEPATIGALHDFLENRFEDISYVVYLRPFPDFVLSAYSEAIRRGSAPELHRFIVRHARRHLYWQRMQRWLHVVGKQRIRVRLLMPEMLEGGDLIDDFCAVCGIDPDGLHRPPRMNPALCAAEINLRRRLNRLLPSHTGRGAPHPLYLAALRFLRPLLARDRTRLTLSPVQKDLLRNASARSDENLRRVFFPDRPKLFP